MEGREAPSAAGLDKEGFTLPNVEVLFIQLGDDVLIEGKAFRPGLGRLVATVNGAPVEVAPNTPLDGPVLFFGNEAVRFIGFAARIPRRPARLEFAWEDDGGLAKLQISYGPHSRLAVRGGRPHGILAGLAFSGEARCLRIEPISRGRQVWRQIGYLGHLVSRLRLRQQRFGFWRMASAPSPRDRPPISCSIASRVAATTPRPFSDMRTSIRRSARPDRSSSASPDRARTIRG